MVADGITGFGKTELIIVDEKATINASYYAEKILPSYSRSAYDTDLFPDPELATLQQDGEPGLAHTSNSFSALQSPQRDP